MNVDKAYGMVSIIPKVEYGEYSTWGTQVPQYVRRNESGMTGILPGKSGIGSIPTLSLVRYTHPSLSNGATVYVFLNQNVHNRSHNGARYNAGGAGVQPRKYECTKKTALPKPGWFYTHKSTIAGVEQLKILKQLPCGKLQCEQRLNGSYVATIILTVNDIRNGYVKVVATKE